jgi:hypothetical protein
MSIMRRVPSRHPRGRGFLLMLALPAAAFAVAPAVETVTVFGQKVANLEPAGSYPALATALRFDPRVDLQTRGLPEGQSDLSIRGGLFENNAIDVGAVAVFDPQTGHYLAELPLDPRMLSVPEVLTGVDNALAGFNSSVATVRYGIAPVVSGGAVAFGVGSDDLLVRDGRVAHAIELERGGELGAAVSYADSRSDGSRPQGDHDFSRLAVQLQHRGDGSQTDLLLGDQNKFFGWPGAYTGFARLPETDDTRTRLALVNHRRELAEGGWGQLLPRTRGRLRLRSPDQGDGGARVVRARDAQLCPGRGRTRERGRTGLALVGAGRG